MPAIDKVLSFLGHATQAGTELATGYGKGKAVREAEDRERGAAEREEGRKRALLALQQAQEDNRERERQRTAERQEERDNARDARDRLTLEVHLRRLKLAEDGATGRGGGGGGRGGGGGGSGRRRDGGADGEVTAGQSRAYDLYSRIAENYVRAAGGDVNAALAEIHKNPAHKAARASGQITSEMLRAARAKLAGGATAKRGTGTPRGGGNRFGGGSTRPATPPTAPAKETITAAEADALRAGGWSDADIRSNYTVR